MKSIDAVGISIRRIDKAALNVDCDVAGAIKVTIDSTRSGRDVDIIRCDVDIAGAHASLIAIDAVAAQRVNGGVLHVDVDVAVARVSAIDTIGSFVRRRDRAVLHIDVDAPEPV